MTDAGARSGRLLAIVLYLQARGRASARELAHHLGVSLRTVYRDVEVLSTIGVPLYAETGRAGGYRLVDGYRTSLTGLTAAESQALFLVGLPEPAASLGLSAPATAAEAKLLAAVGHGAREQANRLRDRLLLDLPAWYAEAERPAALPALAGAVLDERRVRLRYWRWQEPRDVRRTVDPHGLVVKNGAWYVVGRPAGRGRPLRVYRVANVREWTVLEEGFDRVPDFDLARFWRERLAEFDRDRVTAMATVRVSARLAAQLPDLPDHGLRRAVEAAEPGADGWRTVELELESPGHGAARLARYGGEVEVLAPPELRAAVVELATDVLARHGAGRVRRRPAAG